MKVKINTHGNALPEVHGEWIDLCTAEDVTLDFLEYKIISLGVSIEIPAGYYAHVVPRSSTFGKWGILLANSMGVIENDFHDRKDLTPNVCAVYTESDFRRRGIAGALLQFVCRDTHEKGIDTLYLLTDHTGFYERCGWEFFCMAQGDGEESPSRMYVHRYQE